MSNDSRKTFHGILDNEITLVATVVGFVVDLGTILSFVFGFQLFTQATPGAGNQPDTPFYLVWSNPVLQGIFFIILLFSYMVFCRLFYLRIRDKYFYVMPREEIKKRLDTPLRHLVEDPLHLDEMNFDNLSLAISNYIMMSVFPSLFLIWYRVFISTSPALLQIALFLGVVGLAMTILTLKRRDVLRSAIQVSIVLIPVAAGILIIQGINTFLSIFIGVIGIPIFVFVTYALQLLFSVIASYVLSIVLIDESTEGKSLREFENDLKAEEKLRQLPLDRQFAEKAKALAQKSPQEALKLVTRALRLNPDNQRYMQQKMDLLWKTGNLDEACVLFEEILSREPDENEKFLMLVSLGMKLIVAGKTEQGILYLQKASEREPGHQRLEYENEKLLQNAYSALLSQERFPLARKLLDITHAISERPFDYALRRARLSYQMGDYESTLVDVGLALSQDRYLSEYDKSELYLLRGRSLAKGNDWQAAISAFSQSLQQHENRMLYFEAAEVYQAMGDHEQAVKTFGYCIGSYRADESTKIEARYHRAMSLIKTSNFAAAEEDITYYLGKHPKSANAFWMRAGCRKHLNKLAMDVRSDYKSACSLDPANCDYWRDYLLFEIEQKNRDQLFKAIDQLVLAAPPVLAQLRSEPLLARAISLRTKD